MIVKVGLQVANNLAAEFEAEGDAVEATSQVLQAIQGLTTGLEANLQSSSAPAKPDAERRGLIIPEVKVQGPIREDKE